MKNQNRQHSVPTKSHRTPIWVFVLGACGWLITPLISAIIFLLKGGDSFNFGVFFEPYSVSLGAIAAIVGALYEIDIRDKQQYNNFQLALRQFNERLYEIQQTLEKNDYLQHQVGTLVDSYIQLRSGPRGETMGKFADAVVIRAMEELEQLRQNLTYTFEVQSKTEQFSQRWLDSLNEMIRGHGKFMTISSMVVWSQRNLGFRDGYSEYHSKQLISCVDLDYEVQRIFVMPSFSILNSHIDEAKRYLNILQTYQEEVKTAEARIENRQDKRMRHSSRVFVCPNEDRYRDHFKDEGRDPNFSENVALWVADTYSVANTVSYLPNPTSSDSLDGYEIRRIGFTWEQSIIKRKINRFMEIWDSNHTKSLQEYCDELELWLDNRLTIIKVEN